MIYGIPELITPGFFCLVRRGECAEITGIRKKSADFGNLLSKNGIIGQ